MSNNPIINLLRQTWRYASETRQYVVWVFVLTIIANIIHLLEPVVIGRIFNAIQFYNGAENFVASLTKQFSLLIVITVGFWVFHGTSRVLERRNAFIVRKNYKQIILDKTLDLPAGWHKDHHSGDTIDKVNKASEALYDYASTLFMILENVTRLVGSLVILAFFDWKVSLVAFGVTVITILSLSGFDAEIVKRLKKIFKAENYLALAVHDYISNVFTVITLRLKDRVNKEIALRAMKAYPIYSQSAVIIESKWFFAAFVISVMTAGTLIWNAYTSYTANGLVVIGTLFTLYKYLQSVGDTFYAFAWYYGGVVSNDAAVRAAQVIQDDYDRIIPKNKEYLPQDWNTVLVKQLNFSYKQDSFSEAEQHLSQVSLVIERGKRIALIGESGSGKSTVLALLRGLYEAESAHVFCDGKKLPAGLRHFFEHVTLIPQEPEIFNSTIEDNITMGLPANRKDIAEAMRIAKFDRVLVRLEKGLKTNIAEKGVNLSGGEKQRLALARGILASRDSTILLLDEPTSSVDSANEMAIYHELFAKYSDKTIISSVHRLHLLRNFDYIYYFQQGKILAEGTFTALLRDDKFKELWLNYTQKDATPAEFTGLD